MEPETTLSYLMGGQIDPDDLITYSDARVVRRKGVIEPM